MNTAQANIVDQLIADLQQHIGGAEIRNAYGNVIPLTEDDIPEDLFRPIIERAMDRYCLESAPKARGSDPRTSHLAALHNLPRRKSQRATILRAIAHHGAMNAWGIAFRTSLPLNSVSTRMSELVRGGWVTETGQLTPTGTGHHGMTYDLTEKGRVAKSLGNLDLDAT